MTENKDWKVRVAELIEEIRPALQQDGGDVELIEILDNGVVNVRLQGACVGCPMSTLTLKMGIEHHIKKSVPEVVSVESV